MFVWLCHVLVELYYTFEPIWTNLLTQCTQLPVSGFLLFLFFRFSVGLKCPKNSIKNILKISTSEDSRIIKTEDRGHCQPAKRATGAAQKGGRARHPPGCPRWPHEAPLRLYNPLGVETPKQDSFSPEAIPISAAIENKLRGRGDRIPVPAPCRDGEVPPDSSPSSLLPSSMKRE